MKKRITLPILALLILAAVAIIGCANMEREEMIFELNENGDAYILTSYVGGESEVTVPGLYNEKPIKAIANMAFYGNTALRSVTVSNGVEQIGLSAFRDCAYLESVTLSASVETIEKNVFVGCDSLAQIKVDTENLYFSDIDGVLYNKNATELVVYPSARRIDGEGTYKIPSGVKTIGKNAFRGTGRAIHGVIFPDSLETIEAYAFYECQNIKGIDLKNVVSIGKYAFYGCSGIKYLTLPDTVEQIGERAFSKCSSLEQIWVGAGMTEIAEGTFAGCTKITTAMTGENLKLLGENAFYGCTKLSKVLISNSVEEIAEGAFGTCSRLGAVYYRGTEVEFAGIKIGKLNGTFEKAQVIYGYEGN